MGLVIGLIHRFRLVHQPDHTDETDDRLSYTTQRDVTGGIAGIFAGVCSTPINKLGGPLLLPVQVHSEHARGMPMEMKRQALHLYLEGLGFRAIGHLLGVSNVAVLK